MEAPIRALPEGLNPHWVARFVEALLSRKDWCLTGAVAEFAIWLRREPWKWKRPAFKRRPIEMSRGEVLRLCFTKEKTKMLTVSGSAQFTDEGKLLKVETRIQPATPHEHDLLARVAAVFGDEGLTMEQGNLVVKLKMPVPIIQAAPPADGPTASSLDSPSTTASDEGPLGLKLEDVEMPIPQAANDTGGTVIPPGGPAQCSHEPDEKGKACKHCGLSWKKVLAGIKKAGGAVAEAAAEVTVGQAISE